MKLVCASALSRRFVHVMPSSIDVENCTPLIVPLPFSKDHANVMSLPPSRLPLVGEISVTTGRLTVIVIVACFQLLQPAYWSFARTRHFTVPTGNVPAAVLMLVDDLLESSLLTHVTPSFTDVSNCVPVTDPLPAANAHTKFI